MLDAMTTPIVLRPRTEFQLTICNALSALALGSCWQFLLSVGWTAVSAALLAEIVSHGLQNSHSLEGPGQQKQRSCLA